MPVLDPISTNSTDTTVIIIRQRAQQAEPRQARWGSGLESCVLGHAFSVVHTIPRLCPAVAGRSFKYPSRRFEFSRKSGHVAPARQQSVDGVRELDPAVVFATFCPLVSYTVILCAFLNLRSVCIVQDVASAVGCISRPCNHLAFTHIVGSVGAAACAIARSFKHLCLDIATPSHRVFVNEQCPHSAAARHVPSSGIVLPCACCKQPVAPSPPSSVAYIGCSGFWCYL